MPMYNEAWKREYIEYEGVNGRVLESKFKTLGKYEERFGKDLCEMSVDELKSVFASLNIVKPQTRIYTKSMINGYINWCIHTKKTNRENALTFLSVDDMGSPNAITTKMLKSPEQVRGILDIVFPNEYRVSFPNRATLNQLVFWLLYSNIHINEVSLLKKDSIDYDKKIVYSPTNPDITYEVFDDVIPLWAAFINVNDIEYEKVGKNLVTEAKLLNNDFLLRQFDNKTTDRESMSPNKIRAFCYKVFTEYQNKTGSYLLVSASDINLSGYYYRLYASGKTDDEIKEEFSKLNQDNRNKNTSMVKNYNEWRKYFYNE